MNVSQFQQPVRHWRGPEGHECETRNHRFEPKSAIETIFKFSQISRDVFGAHGSARPDQRRLNISQDVLTHLKAAFLAAWGHCQSGWGYACIRHWPLAKQASPSEMTGVPANISIAVLLKLPHIEG